MVNGVILEGSIECPSLFALPILKLNTENCIFLNYTANDTNVMHFGRAFQNINLTA